MDVQYLHYHGLGAPDLVRNHVVGAQLGVMELDRLALHLVEPFESKLDNLVCPLTVFHSSFIEVGIHQLVEILIFEIWNLKPEVWKMIRYGLLKLESCKFVI